MANTLKFGNGKWATGKDTVLAFNDENNNFKPLPFSFSRASRGTVINKDGLIETVGAGEPRIDFKDNTKGALLLEPQRSNLVSYSEELTQWIDAGTTTVLSNITNPSGGLQSYLLSAASSSTNALRYDLSFSASINYSYSLFFKAGTSREVRMQIYDGSSFFRLAINPLNNFEIVDQSGVNSYLIEDFTNGWKKVSINITTSSSASSGYLQIYPDRTGNLNNVYLYGAQLEQGSYATSYIPTSGSAVTRVGDVCNNGANEQVINSTEGVLYWEASAQDNSITTSILSISNGSNANSLYSGFSSASNKIQAQLVVGGVVQTNMTYVVSDRTEFNKVAILYQNNNHKMYVNGVQVSIDTSGSVPSPNTFDRLNFDLGQGSFDFYGNVKDVRVYNTALTDQELQALTQ